MSTFIRQERVYSPVHANELAIFGDFQGEHYRRVKSMYSDKVFIEGLKKIKINIQAGHGLSIGARPAEARSIFFDDGTALRKYSKNRI